MHFITAEEVVLILLNPKLYSKQYQVKANEGKAAIAGQRKKNKDRKGFSK
jgi:hypothetical protein